MTPPLWALVFALTAGLVLWLASLKLKDVGIVDIFWGPGIALVVDIVAVLSHSRGPRAAAALFLVNCWAIRLAAHIFARRFSPGLAGEDHRYAAMRQKFGPSWWWRSLFQVFLLQVILIWFIPAPLVAAMLRGPVPLGLLDYPGIGLAAAGFAFEAVADLQLARFRADPANRGQVMQRGLWGWSRHPNYFGEAAMWGFFLIGFSASGAWWLLLSPVVVTGLLLQVSGVTLMEDKIEERRPAYAAYKRRVSAFVPWLPKRG